MLKMLGGSPEKQFVVLGLSFGNIDEFIAHPNDTHIRVRGDEIGMSFDVILFSGRALRAKGTQNGRDIFMIGFDDDDLTLLRQHPGQAIITCEASKYRNPCDILIVSGETEAHMTEQFAELIGPGTRIRMDDRLKQ